MTDDDAGDGPGALSAEDLADDGADPFEASDSGAGTEADDELGDNIFGGPLERGPIEPGRPDAENVLFVLLGILAGVLVIMRLGGAI